VAGSLYVGRAKIFLLSEESVFTGEVPERRECKQSASIYDD